MHRLCVLLSTTMLSVVVAATPGCAQTKEAAAAPEQPAAPKQSSLTVGALQIGSATKLAVAGIDIAVANGSVTYSYYLQNTGTAEIGVAAAVSLPELQASTDGSETWVLSSSDPENPVGLTIMAADSSVVTKAELHAYALGVDRLSEIRAERLPLIPFGPATDKALAALTPEAVDRLAALGIVSPRDPAHPKAPLTTDWSLDVTRVWRQTLPPGKTVPVTVKFTPVAARYKLAKGDESDLDDMRDDVCLKPEVLKSLKSRLKAAGAWAVTDMTLSADAPSQWIDSPNPTLSVQKPAPDAIVVFCGVDDKTADGPAVLGSAPDDSSEIRVVIFQPAAK
jgi:hypothetical protein